jgi:hypothetical protein
MKIRARFGGMCEACGEAFKAGDEIEWERRARPRPRPRLVQAVEQRGGTFPKVPGKDTDYLVIGTIASRDWAEPSFGRKIEQVVAGRGKGWRTWIVGEERWVEAVRA